MGRQRKILQPLSRPSAVLSSKEETPYFLLNTHRNGEFSMAMLVYRSVTLVTSKIKQTCQLWSLQTPKNLGPQNGVQHRRIPYTKIWKKKKTCFFWCQKKSWEAKKHPSIKNIETIWVVPTYGPKNAIVVFCCAPCPARAVTAEEVVKICLTFMWIIWGH